MTNTHRQIKISQAAADAVLIDGIPRIVIGVDQDGVESEHVLWRERELVRSCPIAEWVGELPRRWPGE